MSDLARSWRRRATAAGPGRMIAPISSQQAGQGASVLYGSLVLLLVIGVVLTNKSYGGSAS
jgi:hypothetical protein